MRNKFSGIMKENIWSVALVVSLSVASCAEAGSARIKDIARIAGLEGVEIIGYGVVIGLNGTGDKDLIMTKQTIANLIENFNISINIADIKSKNSAVVAVTAHLPAFHKAGDKADARVSSMGDATSLEGGTLLMTPLLDPNGEFYAFSQGSVTLGGFSAGEGGAGGEKVTKNHTTVGVIPGGATIKLSQPVSFCANGLMRLLLRNADFTTATRMAESINTAFGGIAVADDAGSITVRVPKDRKDVGQIASFVSSIERLTLNPDLTAKVIVNERTGTIVMGGDVHISEAIVAHGNITVTVKDTQRVTQPPAIVVAVNKEAPPVDIKPVVVSDEKTTVNEEKSKILHVQTTTTVKELAATLNLMGATPRDLISILEALSRLGAIQMELVAM